MTKEHCCFSSCNKGIISLIHSHWTTQTRITVMSINLCSTLILTMSSSLPGSLLLTGVTEVLQPSGSQQLLATGLFFLVLVLLLRLTHPDAVQLPQLPLRALPLSALQPPGLLLPAPLLAGPAGELLCPRICTLL